MKSCAIRQAISTASAVRVLWMAACAVLLCGLSLGLSAALPTSAQAQDTFVRFYYSTWMQGRAEKTPADPNGVYQDGAPLSQNPKVGLEAIFWGRAGFSFSRQKMQRQFEDISGSVVGCVTAPCDIDENTVQESINLTLYAGEVSHNSFNMFAGAGTGQMDYRYYVDGVKQTGGELYKNMGLSRWFFGAEYVYERVGFRLEVSNVSASKTLLGQKAEVEQTFQYLTFIIPLN